MKAILLSGVHGVGKGFFLEKVKGNIQNYDIYSASNLIERYQPSTDSGYKKVSNINSNQDALIRAIKEEKSKNIRDFIIDGHLCVFNASGKVERIPEYFFVDSQISGIVILQDNPQKICDRISQRDFQNIKIEDIEWMQNEEQKYADDLHNKFNIEYITITHGCSGGMFEEILRNIGRKKFE